jgi:hypothetical protein
MNINSLRSSKSSYGERDPRCLSSASYGAAPPPSKVLLDGYKSVLDPIYDEAPGYNQVGWGAKRPLVKLDHADDFLVLLLSSQTLPLQEAQTYST